MKTLSQREIKLIRSLAHKKYRKQTGLFMAEGEKCIRELLPLGCEMIVVSEEFEKQNLAFLSVLASLRETIQVRIASNKDFNTLSQLQTPQGILALFKLPNYQLSTVTSQLTLVLDGIQDPGNLGTIIRTACWFGVEDIICSLNTADAFAPKVVQATMGGLAKVRIHYTQLTDYLRVLPTDTIILGTLLEGEPLPTMLPKLKQFLHPQGNSQLSTLHGSADRKNSQLHLVMGNEGNGISPEVRQLLTHAVRIPSLPENEPPRIESLNVATATAILLSALSL